MRCRSVSLLVLLAIGSFTAVVPARAERVYFEGGYVTGSIPTGDWGKVAGGGLGLDGTTIGRLDANSIFAVRSELGWAYNFSRTVDVPASQLASGDQLALKTSSNMLYLGVGPELSRPKGDLRAFVFGTVGFNTNWTNGGLDGTVNGARYSSNVGATSTAFAWSVGGGLRKMMKGVPGGKIELSVEYRAADGHNYLLPDDVHSSAGGAVDWQRKSNQQQQLLLRVGTVYGP